MSYKYFYCDAELIWQNDFDRENNVTNEECVVQCFECSKCGAYYEVFIPLLEKKEYD